MSNCGEHDSARCLLLKSHRVFARRQRRRQLRDEINPHNVARVGVIMKREGNPRTRKRDNGKVDAGDRITLNSRKIRQTSLDKGLRFLVEPVGSGRWKSQAGMMS